MDETLVAFGDGIKSEQVQETEDSYKFGAFLVVFDSPDISQYKDSFTKSTDFGFEDGETRPLLYNHGLDGTFQKTTIGKARLYHRDAGVWMEGEIKKRRDYLEKHIERVGEGLKATIKHRGIDAPVFGTSSGAAGHTVIREAKGEGHEILQWHVGEASITTTPAEPQTACLSLKSLQEVEQVEEAFKYSPRQPRDDMGKWTDSQTGKMSVGHALHVAAHEGLSAEHVNGIRQGIESGRLDSREKVLAHIDAIHQGKDPHSAVERVVGSEKAKASNAAVGKVLASHPIKPLNRDIITDALHEHAKERGPGQIEEIGKVAAAAARADGQSQIGLSHVFEAIHMAGDKGGFAAHAARVKGEERDLNTDRTGQGLVPVYDQGVARVRAIEKHMAPSSGNSPEARAERRDTHARVQAQRDKIASQRARILSQGRKSADDEMKTLDELERELDEFEAKYNSSQPRGDDGRWSGGSGSAAPSRLPQVPIQLGGGPRRLPAVPAQLMPGRDKGNLSKRTELTDAGVNYLLKQHGFKPNSRVSKVVKEAVMTGHIDSPIALDNVIRHAARNGGDDSAAHNAINLHGDGPNYNGNFRSSLSGGKNKKSDDGDAWDDADDLDYFGAMFGQMHAFFDDAPEEEMASGAPTLPSVQSALSDYVRREAGRHGVLVTP